MKNSTKGALLSGLVYPGVGQISLGRRGVGALFMALATAGLAVTVRGIMNRTSLMMDQITPLLAKGQMTTERLIQTATRHAGPQSYLEDLAVWILICCWAASVGHAYLLGRRIDNNRRIAPLPK